MATKQYLIDNGYKYYHLYSGLDPKTQHCVCHTWFSLRRMRPSTIERIIWKGESYQLTPSQLRNEETMNPKYAGENNA